MNSVDLPHGVPSPYTAHVHPYPTRFHGGIWTRPVFGFPWVERPSAVFRPSQLTGMGAIDPVFRPYKGLGNEGGWDVGSGVFRRPLYDGSGIFNDVSGLGAIPDNAKKFLVAGVVAFGIVAFALKR